MESLSSILNLILTTNFIFIKKVILWIKQKIHYLQDNYEDFQQNEHYQFQIGNAMAFIFSILILLFYKFSDITILCFIFSVFFYLISYTYRFYAFFKIKKINNKTTIYKTICFFDEIATMINPILVPFSFIFSTFGTELEKQYNMLVFGTIIVFFIIIIFIICLFLHNKNKEKK